MKPDDLDAAIERAGGAQHLAIAIGSGTAPSEDAIALRFVDKFDDVRFVPPWHKWLRFDGKRWREDQTSLVYARVRELVREAVGGTKAERGTATAAFVSGVERLLRADQRLVLLPYQLDADPWLLNAQNGIIDLRTGQLRPHDPNALLTRIAGAAFEPEQGRELWDQFLNDITCGDHELAEYLQRVAGYCATGDVTEDVLVYLFGIGANGKSSFAEAVSGALGDYARLFPAEVLMESKGERHPTELAQFMGVRFALTSEPAASAAWNDSRLKSLTGDATISARFMRGDFFEFRRTHKTMVLGNHMPRLADVTPAMRRRVQMVPFRAVFRPTPGQGMRERLKSEAMGAILAWISEGARLWLEQGTNPPQAVREMTQDYLSEQDVFGQWLVEECDRDAAATERASDLYGNYKRWCERRDQRPDSSVKFSASLIGAGIQRKSTAAGNLYLGLRLRPGR